MTQEALAHRGPQILGKEEFFMKAEELEKYLIELEKETAESIFNNEVP